MSPWKLGTTHAAAGTSRSCRRLLPRGGPYNPGLGFRVQGLGLINPLSLMGIINGIQTFRPLKGGGLLIMGLHDSTKWCILGSRV